MMKTISIVAPCYNESENVRDLHRRVKAVFEKLSYQYELIIVDNASTDNSPAIYQELVAQDPAVKVLFMARNTGNSQPGYFAGLTYAAGDAVVLLDGDLQDPPEIIPQFIEKWEQGFEIAFGIRVKRKETFPAFFYRAFYIIFKWLSYLDMPVNAGDFGILDRRVVDIIIRLSEKDLYLRGLRAWVGFKQCGVEYERHGRLRGMTTNSFLRNIYWAKKAIVNFSYKPLEYISGLAMATAVVTGFAICYYFYAYFHHGAPRGFTTLLLAMLILNSMQLLALSIIGEYLIRIFQEVKNRPTYLIDKVLTSERVEIAQYGKVPDNRGYRVYRDESHSSNSEHTR